MSVEAVFLKLVNMSISATWLMAAVVLIRLIFARAPKGFRCVLWGLAGIRLILPFSFESAVSLIPSTQTFPQDILITESPKIHSGIASLNSTVNPIISGSLAPESTSSVNPMQTVTFAASLIWIGGMAAAVLYAAVSYIRIRRRVGESAEVADGIRICDRIASPFILGIFRPVIYLPSHLSDTDSVYVIAHERAHLARRDQLWKPLGFILLTLHWFNPAVWVAYILFCRDIELACDERVIRILGTDAKKPYSDALINCSAPGWVISACPLSFGETGVKGRIRSVLNYRKPGFWIILLSVVVCIAAGVFFLTDPPKGNINTEASLIYEGQDPLSPYSAKYAFSQSESVNWVTICIEQWHGGYLIDQCVATEKADISALSIVGDENDLSMIGDWSLVEVRLYGDGVRSVSARFNAPSDREYNTFDHDFIGTDNVGDRTDIVPGDGYILAAWQYFEGNGALAYDCEEFTDNDEYMGADGYMIVVRAIFTDSKPEDSAVSEENVPDRFESAIAAVDFDIDGDGVQEKCTVSYGPTSGLFTFRFDIWENGYAEYSNIFLSQASDFVFVDGSDGKLYLSAIDQADVTVLFEVLLEDGNIVLECDGERLAYWGDLTIK